MDFVADYISQLYSLYSVYSTTYYTYFAPIYRVVFLAQSYLYRYIYPLAYPIYTLTKKALQSLSSESPDLLSLLLLGVILLISVRVLEYVRRTIVFWISLAVRVGIYLSLTGLGIYVWHRGFEQSLEDFGWMWGLLEGLNNEGQRVGDQRARAREREAQRVKQARAGKRGRNRGAGW